jgi:flagellar protein FliO/FliZ
MPDAAAGSGYRACGCAGRAHRAGAGGIHRRFRRWRWRRTCTTTAGHPPTPARPLARDPLASPAPRVVMPAAPAPSPGSLLQTILALILVLGLLLGLAWFFKRYGPRGLVGSANVKLVGALNIGGRERIIVVEVGDQWIVVGASPGRVNALATMPRREGADPQAALSAHAPPATSFGDWLKNTIDKRNAKT